MWKELPEDGCAEQALYVVQSFCPNDLCSPLVPVRSEGGQDCLKAQEDSQTSAGLNSSGLDSGMSGFSSASINSAQSMYGVKSEPDNWGMSVLM